jgi:hypothetical protein
MSAPAPAPSRPAPVAAPAPPQVAAPAPAPKPSPASEPPDAAAPAAGDLKDAFLAGIRKGKGLFYGTVVAEAQGIDVAGDRIIFRFGQAQTMLAGQVGQQKAWLETLAQQVAGRRMSVAAEVVAGAGGASAGGAARASSQAPGAAADLRDAAKQNPAVQALLDVFPAEVKDVTELNKP